MRTMEALTDKNFDDHVDAEIQDCLSLERPGSFFLFAGAGSGKTRSLVNAINSVLSRYGPILQMKSRYIGVITYTNAACDEIGRRVEFNSTVRVSTIHSFIWSLIEGFNSDIKEWLGVSLREEITILKGEQARARGANKTFEQRARRIVAKERRLVSLDVVRKITYNPEGDNIERDSLNHSEVISLGVKLLTTKAVMQEILISRFPILLIDESQDTNGALMTALIAVQNAHAARFSLGLFGDTMQRIYNDGLVGLKQSLPSDWKTPVKVMNHRCPSRIVKLINDIRADSDQVQRARTDAKPGVVKFFILKADCADKAAAERAIAREMAKICNDNLWNGDGADEPHVKRLILEHRMAAVRMCFLPMFEPLYGNDRLKTGFLNGTLPAIQFFSSCVLPLVEARQRKDEFALATVLRNHSPLFNRRYLANLGTEERGEILVKAREAVDELCSLWDSGGRPTFLEILTVANRHSAFKVPRSLLPFANVGSISAAATEIKTDLPEDDAHEEENSEDTTAALSKFLDTDFGQMKAYVSYIDGTGGFGTHQGVKGLEFPRVMVVMDDSDMNGFLFSYEKLFGAKARSKADLENEATGKDSGITRTKRLFYVTCSRAEQSLALVAYSDDPVAVQHQVLANGWFSPEEISMV